MAFDSIWCESNPERMNERRKERPTFIQVEFQLGCVFHVFSFCIWAYITATVDILVIDTVAHMSSCYDLHRTARLLLDL